MSAVSVNKADRPAHFPPSRHRNINTIYQRIRGLSERGRSKVTQRKIQGSREVSPLPMFLTIL